MSIRKYFKFVDIKTSALSLYAYALGAAFIFYYFNNWNWLNSLIFFISEMILDNMITAINNVMDYILAKDKTSKQKSVLVTENISLPLAFTYIGILLLIAAILGIWLCFRTNWVLFFAGGLLFLIVLSYTSGPFPISRMPIGEFVCGIAQGMGVPFLFTYINDNYQKIMTLNFNRLSNGEWTFGLTGSLTTVFALVVLCIPSICYNSNVMLANNMSDVSEDRKNERATLPVVFGKMKADWLYRFFGYIPFLFIIIMPFFKMAPWLVLLTLATFPKVKQNIETFIAHPDKVKTFPSALQNYTIFVLVQAITIFVGALIHF
ncbi:UbiA family prenyltransferase [Lactobacillus ultunensis]|uniref:Putative 1,4-dihydroxy-2-naphthoate octaprenyltransferase n=1 Tax=Lactobacillus ultunensis DSM 16047 TaxID=525365 RepID=C2EQZ2_9LACO|nr:UbiA family prenyltransferase [Lactobacillus ultunensis]EEJ71145.1 putative 1,4-dihydroxy-2-naphthoate octaprenyltransferase [Lactobacillus ultunensis DSM 16047]KRL82738.1 1,4-dihydroxy-2-naphthoate octaprenyltransferase [Lactobacillus ultunensis DSM 16047]QQP28909.1 UbiA family prenyltransferase [Lactobacillus ultunensis]